MSTDGTTINATITLDQTMHNANISPFVLITGSLSTRFT